MDINIKSTASILVTLAQTNSRGPSCYCWIWKAVAIRRGWRQHGTGASNGCFQRHNVIDMMGIVRKVLPKELADSISCQDLTTWCLYHFVVGWNQTLQVDHLVLLVKTSHFPLVVESFMSDWFFWSALDGCSHKIGVIETVWNLPPGDLTFIVVLPTENGDFS
jgi:hypothetical protein